jgi:TadE-like protein
VVAPRRRLLGDLAAAERGQSDRGAAVAEFAMISVLLLLLLFGVVQVAVYFYVRTIVAASAADAARFAGNEGVSSPNGGDRASMLIRQAATAEIAQAIRCDGGDDRDVASGLVEAVVRCHGPVRLAFLPLNMPLTIDVTARSVKELPPQ